MDGLGTSGVAALESEQLKEPLVVGIAAGKSDGDGSAALAAARTPSTWGRDGVAVDNVDLAPGVTADLDRRGHVLGLEVLHASRHLRPLLAGLVPASGRSGSRARTTEPRTSRGGGHPAERARAKRTGLTPSDVDREVAAPPYGQRDAPEDRLLRRSPAYAPLCRWLPADRPAQTRLASTPVSRLAP